MSNGEVKMRTMQRATCALLVAAGLLWPLELLAFASASSPAFILPNDSGDGNPLGNVTRKPVAGAPAYSYRITKTVGSSGRPST